MPIAYARIFKWLEKVEGKMTCRGYIPCYRNSGGTANYYGTQPVTEYRAMGVSGVTIGVGVDLGQQTISQLRRWGVSDATLAKLQPYIGKKQGEALRALRNAPLSLTPDEATELTAAEHRGYMDSVVIPWWSRGEHTMRFADLPWQAQCVLFSLTYQCGTKGAEKRGPVTISAMRRGDWKKASAALRDCNGWGGEYVSRRFQEGTLLMEVC